MTITEQTLEALGFNKVIWNGVMPDYWKSFYPETGDYYKDSCCRLDIHFKEFRCEPPDKPHIYVCAFGMTEVKGVRTIEELQQLYRLLTGQELKAVKELKE